MLAMIPTIHHMAWGFFKVVGSAFRPINRGLPFVWPFYRHFSESLSPSPFERREFKGKKRGKLSR
jgi:hypothetical protein